MSAELRANWGEVLTDVYDKNIAIAISSGRGKPEAVLMSYELWEEGQQRENEVGQREYIVPEGELSRWKSLDARDNFRDLRDSVRRGQHALITRWGKPQLVFTPVEWTRKAMPDLGVPE